MRTRARGVHIRLSHDVFAHGAFASWYYLNCEGVQKDAAYAVTLFRQIIDEGDELYATKALAELAYCYSMGDGVEADTAQAALWCQRAADGGDAFAITSMPIIRTCNFCSSRPARKHCERCRKVRYCNTQCQTAHWNCETDPHKGHCRRTMDASLQETGGVSTSAHTQ